MKSKEELVLIGRKTELVGQLGNLGHGAWNDLHTTVHTDLANMRQVLDAVEIELSAAFELQTETVRALDRYEKSLQAPTPVQEARGA